MILHPDEAPQLGIVGAGHVTQPGDITFTLTSNVPLGWFDLQCTDAVGEHHAVGSRPLDRYQLLLTISTGEMCSGPVTLHATVAGEGTNVAVSNRTVQVDPIEVVGP